MKLIDKNGKLFSKLNLVDLGIVLLLIFAVLAVGYKVMREKYVERETVKIEYTLCVEGVRQQSVDAINKVHENVVDAEKEEALGDIKEVKVEAAKQIVLKSSGEYEVAEIPNKFDLYVTLVTDGVVSPDGYFTEGGKKILYGDTIGVNNGYSQMFGVVENITVVK